jgi:hypothetical protein
VVCDPTHITYFTGFRFLSTERPTVYLQNAAGDDFLARGAADLGLRGTIAADHDGYPGILGYIGPKLLRPQMTRTIQPDSRLREEGFNNHRSIDLSASLRS